MILYFSGTGNSLQVAKQIAEQTSDTCVSMFGVDEQQLLAQKRIGFVFPVYNYGIPAFVSRAIAQMQLPQHAYIYVAACHGGDVGNTIFQFSELLKPKGCTLAYAADVKMPVNSRIMYSRVTDQVEKRITATKQKLDVVTQDINNKVCNVKKLRERWLLKWVASKVTSDTMRKRYTPVVDTELCVNCGICVKVCPVQNIDIRNNKAFIGSECEQCVTCMHWCPQTAIHFPKTRVKAKQQYHHPNVKWTDVQVKKRTEQ